mgnify:CR=1 FL=1
MDFKDENRVIDFYIEGVLTNREKKPIKSEGEFQINYKIDKNNTIISAIRKSQLANGDTMVLPLISPTGEKVKQSVENRIEIYKPEGIVLIEANVPIAIKNSEKGRFFNQVPGMECIPIMVVFPKGVKEVVCSIKVV